MSNYASRGPRTALDREFTAHKRRDLHRQIQRADAPDFMVCTCGWITGRDVCPNCGLQRVEVTS